MRRWQCKDTDTQGERRSCDDKGRDWCYTAASEEQQELSTNRQEERKVSEGAWPYRHLVWTSRLQNCEIINFCCLKPPDLWYFVMAAQGNKDSAYSEILRNQMETRHCKSPF